MWETSHAIAAGQDCSYFVDNEGNVWACGLNHKLQLGIGERTSKFKPEKVPGLSNIYSINCCSFDTSFFFGNFNEVFSAPDSTYANHTTRQLNVPPANGKIYNICGNRNIFYYLNSAGDIVNEKTTKVAVANRNFKFLTINKAVLARNLYCLDEEGSVYTVPARGIDHGSPVATKMENLPEIDFIAAGTDHVMFLDKNGGVWATGESIEGQLGIGSSRKITEIVQVPEIPPMQFISCGHSFTLLLDKAGKVWGCGKNESGQLGLSHGRMVVSPCAIDPFPELVMVSAGSKHSLFLDKRGVVWAAGSNSAGALGRNDCADSIFPLELRTLPPVHVVQTASKIKNARFV